MARFHDTAAMTTWRRLRVAGRGLGPIAALLASSPAAAGDTAAPKLVLKPIVDARLRYEHVEQVPFARDADAVTARVRAGIDAGYADFSLLAESEAVLAINPAYNSGLNGKTAFPMVSDPQNIELNRLQMQYLGVPKTIVTLGRQRIMLDDQRFVGAAGWRDSEQTFDAARVEWSGVRNLKADLTYARGVRTIWGIDGGNRFGPARYQGIGGDNVFATLAFKSKFGTLTGFAYLVDQDAPLVLANSSQSYGARFAGTQVWSSSGKVNYSVSYARQSDYARNPNHYSADYYIADLGVEAAAFKLGGGYEVRGASDGAPLTSFQTPLAALHKFSGWADKFLVAPPNGLRDAYGSLGYGWRNKGPLDAIALYLIYHHFDSDRLGQHYGNEIDAQLTLKHGKYTGLVKYADYSADALATDTRKLWLSLEWSF